MSLPYLIIPNPTGQNSFRARVKLGPQVPTDEFLNAVVDRATVEKVTRSLFKIARARNGRTIGNILCLFRARPTISGSYPTNNPSDNDIKNGVSFRISTGPEAANAMTDALSVSCPPHPLSPLPSGRIAWF